MSGRVSSSPRSRRASPRAVLNLALAFVLVAAGTGAVLLLQEEQSAAAPVTTEVTRGTVIATVSATGNVVAARDVGVDFAGAGRLATVRVEVGDEVRRGEVLARLDDAAAVDQRDTARAQLDQARANLRIVTDGPSDADLAASNAAVRQAQASVTAARRSLADVRRVARTNRRVYDQQVRVAEREVDSAETSKRRATTGLTDATADLEKAELAEQSACAASSDDTTGLGTIACVSAQSSVQAAEQAVVSAETALASAAAGLSTALDQLRAAEQTRSIGNAQQTQSVGSAESALRSAEASYDASLATARAQTQGASDAEVAAARAQVDSAEVSLRTAQRAVDDTVLVAPVDGTVAYVDGEVGEYVGGGRTGGSAGSGSSVTATGPAASVGATGFVVLTAVDGLQVRAHFSEADVSQLSPGRGASVAFEALDRVGLDSGTNAEIITIAPTSVVTDNVVTYEVYAALDAPPRQLKIGQTATLDVVLAESTDTLLIPSSAVTTTGATSTVTVYADDEEQEREVEIGVVGDSTTEILSGLAEGEDVVTTGGGGLPGGFPGINLPNLPGRFG